MKFNAEIDNGQGGTTKFIAENIESATVKATEWAQAGEWREDGSVSVRVWAEKENVTATFDVPVTKSEIFA